MRRGDTARGFFYFIDLLPPRPSALRRHTPAYGTHDQTGAADALSRIYTVVLLLKAVVVHVHCKTATAALMRAVDISHKTRGILNFTIHTAAADPFPSPRRFQGDSTIVLKRPDRCWPQLISLYALHVTGARDRRETASLLKRNNSRREYRPGFPRVTVSTSGNAPARGDSVSRL